MTATLGVVPSVRLFGGCRVSVDGIEAAIGGQKPQALLARLAWANGRVVPTETLIDDIWGEGAPAGIRASLQMHVTALRRALAGVGADGVLLTRSPGYLLDLPRPSVDLLRFADLVDTAVARTADTEVRLALAEEALRLWDAPPLAGLTTTPFAERVERWCERRRIDLIVAVASGSLSADAARALLPLVEPIADQHPLDVPVNAARATLLHLGGRTRDALASIARLRAVLREETGLPAGAAIDDLERELLRSADEPRRTSAPTRPATTTDDLARVERSLRRSRIVTVCGAIGSPARSVVRACATNAAADGVEIHEVVERGLDEIPSVGSSGRQLVVLDASAGRPVDLDRLSTLLAVPGRRILCHAHAPLGIRDEEVVRVFDHGDEPASTEFVTRRIAELGERPLEFLVAGAQWTTWFDERDADHLWWRPRPAGAITSSTIEHLAERGLIEIDRRRPHPYRVPSAVRRVCREPVFAPTSARGRSTIALAARARATSSRIGTSGEPQAVEWFEHRIDDLDVCAHDESIPLTIRRDIARAMVHWLLITGKAGAALSLLERLSFDESASPRDLATMASTAAALDEYAIVDRCHRRALESNGSVEPQLSFTLVRTLRHRCRFERAHELLARLDHLESVADTVRTMERGMLLATEGRTDSAREQLAEARQAFERLAIERAVGACWAYDAWCRLADGQVSAAAAGLERAAGIAGRLSHPADQAFTAVLLGHCDRLDGRKDSAVRRADAAAAYFERAGDRLGWARAMELRATSDAAGAGDDAERAQRLRSRLGAPRSPLEQLVIERGR